MTVKALSVSSHTQTAFTYHQSVGSDLSTNWEVGGHRVLGALATKRSNLLLKVLVPPIGFEPTTPA